MDFQIDQNEIAQRVTNEVLKEIEESNTTFTNDEIKEKINNKLDEIFKAYRANEDKIKRKKDEEDERIIEKEFTDINEFGNPITKDDKFDSLLESIENEYGNEEESIEDELSEKIEENEPEDKKKFIEEFADLYKNELQNSIDSFKNAYESFKLMKKTSIVEKVLILLFLAVPAIFGGLLTLFFILILLLLWQIHILLKVFIKFFDRVETSIKETMAKIRKKIDTLKNSGGFFNRLIFSNSLYSLIMFNGILYMLVKGMMLPLKSAAEIDRILANLVSKGVRAATMGLRGPSELALANLRGNALRSGKTALKETAKGRNKLQLRDLLKARQNLRKKNNDMTKKVEAVKGAVLKNKAIFLKDAIAKDIGVKLQAAQNGLVEQKLNAIAEKNSQIQTPSSSTLSNVNNKKDELMDLISAMLRDSIADRIKADLKDNFLEQYFEGQDSRNSKSQQKPLEASVKEVLDEDRNATNVGESHAIGIAAGMYNNDVQSQVNQAEASESLKQANNMYERGVNTSEALSMAFKDFNKMDLNEQLDKAIAFGYYRDAQEDRGFNEELKQYAESEPRPTAKEVAEKDLELAREDLENEKRQFQEKYGARPEELMAEKMKEHGFSPYGTLPTKDFIELAKEVVVEQVKNETIDEKQQFDMIKDLGEYGAAFVEKERAKSKVVELNPNTKEKSHVDSINRSSGREIAL